MEPTEEKKPPKQVMVVRSDLKMQRGKEDAQCAHASMSFIAKRLYIRDLGQHHFGLFLSPVEVEWLYNGKFTKITLSVDSEAALDAIYQKAKDAGLEAHLIVDSGMTVFHGVPTKTVVAIGPDFAEKIDPVTRGLKLR